MTRQNYSEILNLLRGLNDAEIKLLQKHLNQRVASEKGSPLKKTDDRYVEVKRIQKKRKDDTLSKPNYYKYYRWREDGKLKSKYIEKATENEYKRYRQGERIEASNGKATRIN